MADRPNSSRREEGRERRARGRRTGKERAPRVARDRWAAAGSRASRSERPKTDGEAKTLRDCGEVQSIRVTDYVDTSKLLSMSARPRSRSRSPIRRPAGDRRSGGGRGQRASFDPHSDKLVYLSNLPYEMGWMKLKDIIKEKAGEVAFVETLENKDGRSKGCAIVEFKHKDAAAKCVEAMHRTELNGRQIVAKEIRDPVAFFRKVKEDTGVDFLGGEGGAGRGGGGGGRDRRFSDGPRHVPIRNNDNETYGLSPAFLNQLNIKTPLVSRIFISNISYTCGVGRLFDVFSLAGKITWFDLQLDDEGKSKGMAVVQYSHPIEAVQAISMLNNQRLFDRVLAVRMDRFEKEAERREGELPTGLRGIGMGLGANGAPLADVASVISSLAPSAPVQPYTNGNGLAAPQINPFGGNPYGAPMVQQAPAVPAMMAPQPTAFDGHHLGGGYQAAAPQQNVYATPQAQQAPTGGYFAAAPQAAPVPQPAAPMASGFQRSAAYEAKPPMGAGSGGYAPSQHAPSQQSYGGGAFGSAANTSGGGYDTQSSRVILIKNLPLDYTWQIVSDRVQQFGELESVEMVSPGVAKVRFVQLPSAERAKATLEGTTVEGRVIGIEYL
ncbi:Protein C25A1.4 [Aphelenchoides avenae]|nr:Protein C25A1.4 [Aphelenchus avenae]